MNTLADDRQKIQRPEFIQEIRMKFRDEKNRNLIS